MIKKPIENIKLLYKGSRDGFRNEKLMKECENMGPTLIIIESKIFK